MIKCCALQQSFELYPKLNAAIPVWQAVSQLVGCPFELYHDNMSKTLQRPMGNYPAFRKTLEDLGNSVGPGTMWGRWDSVSDLQKDLRIVEEFMLDEKNAASFDADFFKSWLADLGIRKIPSQSWEQAMKKKKAKRKSYMKIPQEENLVQVLLATECLRIWLHEVVKQMRQQAV